MMKVTIKEFLIKKYHNINYSTVEDVVIGIVISIVIIVLTVL